MFFHHGSIDLVNVAPHGANIEFVGLELFMKFTGVDLCDIEVSLFMGKDVIILNSAPRQVLIEPAFDVIFQPVVIIAEIDIDPATG